MAATTPPPTLQFSWLGERVVAWQPGKGVYGGNLHHDIAAVTKRPSVGVGATRVVTLDLPTGEANFMVDRKSTRLNSSHRT